MSMPLGCKGLIAISEMVVLIGLACKRCQFKYFLDYLIRLIALASQNLSEL